MTERPYSRLCRRALLVVGALTLGALIPTGAALATTRTDLAAARSASEKFEHVATARSAGYAQLLDSSGTACIDNPGVGTMGIHYVNGSLVGDPAINANAPEALVYDAETKGRLRLVAAEYIVLQSAWQGAGHTSPPTLFGQQFELVPSPNRYALPPFYELHAWLWKYNTLGMFNDWNPQVSCRAAIAGALGAAHEATAMFQHIAAARHAGYARLLDAAGIACIDNPGVGTMGIHYVNGSLVGDPAINAETPEALVYEPEAKGRLRLVAAEYIVLESAWDAAGHTIPPALFGQQFELIPSPNRYGLPPFYELHSWLWKQNPLGMFNDWNPLVSCSEL
jgi:hypothetical protein